jgi:hypothetical protein
VIGHPHLPRGGYQQLNTVSFLAARSRNALCDFAFLEPLPTEGEVANAPLTAEAGLLPPRQFDGRLGLRKQFAPVLDVVARVGHVAEWHWRKRCRELRPYTP